MTNADPLLVAPPRFYWYLHLSRADQAKVLKEGNKQAAEEFVAQVKEGVDMLVRREPDTLKRLMAYREKPATLWCEQMEKFPSGYWWAFKESWDDWVKLSPVDFIRDERMGEIMTIFAMRQAPLQVVEPDVQQEAVT